MDVLQLPVPAAQRRPDGFDDHRIAHLFITLRTNCRRGRTAPLSAQTDAEK